MSEPEVVFDAQWSELLPSEGNMNSVIIMNVKTYKILENPSTNSQAITDQSIQLFPPVHIDINLHNRSQEYIQSFLQNQLAGPDWLCSELASYISTCISYSPNGFLLTVIVKITYRTSVVSPPSINDEQESLDREELNESCSICLDDLFDSSKHGDLTRMECSHVFHDHCLLKWLHRKNTCPLCRTLLYDH